jgi:hypothetical protein
MDEIYVYLILFCYALFNLIADSVGINMLDQVPKQISSSGTVTVPGKTTTDASGNTVTAPDQTSNYTATSPYSKNNPAYYNAIILLSLSIALNLLVIMYCIFKFYVLYTEY